MNYLLLKHSTTLKLRMLVVVACIMLISQTEGNAQFGYTPSTEDVAIAEQYAAKYKEDKILVANAEVNYEFDKGTNALKDKVVNVTSNAIIEYMALKSYSRAEHVEYYNKFISLDKFGYGLKARNSYSSYTYGGYDRSVTDENLFFDDSRVQYMPVTLTSVGQGVRFKIRKSYDDSKYFSRIFFQEYYPIKTKKLEFKIPKWLEIEFIEKNFTGYSIDKSETTKGGYRILTYTINNIAPFKNEYARIGHAVTAPHIIIHNKSFEQKGEQTPIFEKVDDVYKWNNRLYNMAGNDVSKLKPLTDQITKGKSTAMDKAKAIYYWVQDNIRYIAYEDGYSGYIPDAAQEVVAKKYGDCKGMANLVTELMKLAGLDAHFSWIGTRSIPYSQSLPALCVNDHAISTLFLDGKTYFIDGTESFGPFGENAFRIQGKEVMVAMGDNFKIIPVPMSAADENKMVTKADFTLKGDVLNGKATLMFYGNQRTAFHQSYQNLPSRDQKEFIKDYLKFGSDNIIVNNIAKSDMNNREIPVKLDAEIDLSNHVSNISADKYVGLDFFPKSLERYIPDENRVSGYDLNKIIKFEDEISLTIPADKKFVDKPDDLVVSNEMYDFSGTYTITGNKITLKKMLSLKTAIINKKDFTNWTSFVNSIKEFNNYLLTVTQK
jgi:hypothetical protein